MLLGKEEGDVDALKQMSIEELESLVGLQTSTTKETSAK
jgi:hypothetical protein